MLSCNNIDKHEYTNFADTYSYGIFKKLEPTIWETSSKNFSGSETNADDTVSVSKCWKVSVILI
jgi:hypothetical protein